MAALALELCRFSTCTVSGGSDGGAAGWYYGTARVRVINRNRSRIYIVANFQRFSLIAEEHPFAPEDFSIMVPFNESRDVDVDFVIPAGLGQTRLRMMLWEAQVDIPLDPTPPGTADQQPEHQASASTE